LAAISRESVAQAVVGVYAALILSFWGLLSFLPLAGVLIDGASPISIVGDVIFFALGFGGFATAYILALFVAQPAFRVRIYASLRGRVGLVSVYATIWLVAYWLFKFLVV
jgi:hypothetical protein